MRNPAASPVRNPVSSADRIPAALPHFPPTQLLMNDAMEPSNEIEENGFRHLWLRDLALSIYIYLPGQSENQDCSEADDHYNQEDKTREGQT
jgi:hypothetical protein